MKKKEALGTSGFTIAEVIIASGLAVIVALVATQQLKQVSQLSKSTENIGSFEFGKDTLHGVIDYAFRRAETVVFTQLPPGAPHPPNDATPDNLNTYRIAGQGAIVLRGDMRVCFNDRFAFRERRTVPPAALNPNPPIDQVFILCCQFNVLNNAMIDIPANTVAGNTVQDSIRAADIPCRDPNRPGLSIIIVHSDQNPRTTQSICIDDIQEMNVQIAGVINDKTNNTQNTELYFIDLWTGLKTEVNANAPAPRAGGTPLVLTGAEERLQLLEFINYPPVDCHETIPKMRGFVPR